MGLKRAGALLLLGVAALAVIIGLLVFPGSEEGLINQLLMFFALYGYLFLATHAGTRAYYHDYPCPTEEAARWFVGQGIALLGLDTPSADPTESPATYPVHEIVLGAGIPIVEGLVHLGRLRGVTEDLFFLGFPLKMAGVEGSPIRAAGMILRP